MSASQGRNPWSSTRGARAAVKRWTRTHPKSWRAIQFGAVWILGKIGFGLLTRFAPQFSHRVDDTIRWFLPAFFVAIGLFFSLGTLFVVADFLKSVSRRELTSAQMEKKRGSLVFAIIAGVAMTMVSAFDYYWSLSARDRLQASVESASPHALAR